MRFLLLTALCAIAAVYLASLMQLQATWARELCGFAGEACANPRWLLIAISVLILVFALVHVRNY